MFDYDIIKAISDQKKKEMRYYYKYGERIVINEIAKKHGLRNNILSILKHLEGKEQCECRG